MSTELDDGLKRLYVQFNQPADEIVRRPALRDRFCALVREESDSMAAFNDEQITKRLIQLRKRGAANGGLPRIRH